MHLSRERCHRTWIDWRVRRVYRLMEDDAPPAVGADMLAVSGKALTTLPALQAAWRLVAGDTPGRNSED